MVDPVAVLVGGDDGGGLRPGGIEEGVAEVDGVEFLLAGEVVADVAVVDGGVAAVAVGGKTDEAEDGDRATAPGVEDFPTLSAGDLALGVLVPAEVVAVDLVELTDEAPAEAGAGVGVKPPAVGDETEDSSPRDTPPVTSTPRTSEAQRKASM